ncbi:Hsp20/alpha crystallin family protein [bacterium]|nr:Hsp20/alpha crystallin family protein [bacterium]
MEEKMTYYISRPVSMARRMWRMMDNDLPVMEADVVFPMDVKADEDGYTISAVLPGVEADDLSIQIVNDTVSLQGEFKNERDENARYLLAERPFGKFSRTITLADPLDAARAEAELKNGILTLRVPKAEEAKPKSIKVLSK